MSKKPKFECDTNGSIVVTSALRYALGRHTYVPGSVQEWIKVYWQDLDDNTKNVIVRDIFEHLYEEHKLQNSFDFDLKGWENFGIDRYWTLGYDGRKWVDETFYGHKKDWFDKNLKPLLWNKKEEIDKLRLKALEELSALDQKLGFS